MATMPRQPRVRIVVDRSRHVERVRDVYLDGEKILCTKVAIEYTPQGIGIATLSFPSAAVEIAEHRS